MYFVADFGINLIFVFVYTFYDTSCLATVIMIRRVQLLYIIHDRGFERSLYTTTLLHVQLYWEGFANCIQMYLRRLPNLIWKFDLQFVNNYLCHYLLVVDFGELNLN